VAKITATRGAVR